MTDSEPVDVGPRLPFTKIRDFVLPLLFAVIFGALTMLVLSSRQPTYASTGIFYVFDGQDRLKVATGGLVGASGSLGGYLQSIAESSAFRLSVAMQLDLANNSLFWSNVEDGARGELDTVEQFSRVVSIDSDGGEIAFTVRTIDAELSARIAAAVMESLEERIKADAVNKTSSHEANVQKLLKEIEKKEIELESFRQESGLLTEAVVDRRVETASAVERSLMATLSEQARLEAQASAPGNLTQMYQNLAQQAGSEGSEQYLRAKTEEMNLELKAAPEKMRKLGQLTRELRVLYETHRAAALGLEAARLDLERELWPLRIVQAPMVPDAPERAHRLRYILGVSLVGFGLGAGLTYLLLLLSHQRRQKFRTPE